MNQSKTPIYFYILGVFFILWNLLGIVMFYNNLTISPEEIAKLPINQQELYSDVSYPLWTKINYGIAVLTGFFGSLLHLLKKNWSEVLAWVSLICVTIWYGHNLVCTKSIEIMGVGIFYTTSFILLMAIFFVWFCHNSKMKSWY